MLQIPTCKTCQHLEKPNEFGHKSEQNNWGVCYKLHDTVFCDSMIAIEVPHDFLCIHYQPKENDLPSLKLIIDFWKKARLTDKLNFLTR